MAVIILFNDKCRVIRTQGVILVLFMFVCFATSSSSSSLAASKIGACENVVTHFQSKGFSTSQLPEQPTDGKFTIYFIYVNVFIYTSYVFASFFFNFIIDFMTTSIYIRTTYYILQGEREREYEGECILSW